MISAMLHTMLRQSVAHRVSEARARANAIMESASTDTIKTAVHEAVKSIDEARHALRAHHLQSAVDAISAAEKRLAAIGK